MSQKNEDKTEESFEQPKDHSYKIPVWVSIFIGFMAIQGIGLGIIAVKESLLGTVLSFGFGFFCIYLIYFLSSNLVFNNKTIRASSIFKKPQTITWEQIEKVSGHPFFQGIGIYIKGEKIGMVPGQLPKLKKFVKFLRSYRRDLFTSNENLIFQRPLGRTVLLIGLVVLSPFLFQIPCSGWILGTFFFISGAHELIRLPHKLILTTTGKAVINLPFKQIELNSTELRPPMDFSGNLFKIICYGGDKFRMIPLRYLSNNNALLYCYLRTWWEDHQKFLAIPLDFKEHDPCECCGNTSLTVWGDLQEKEELAAIYYVTWTHQRPDHGATVDLIIGKFGEDATNEDRYGVSLAYRIHEGVPQFMVIDANQRPISESDFVGTSFTREQVINSPLKNRIFSMVDEIFIQDNRIAELQAG